MYVWFVKAYLRNENIRQAQSVEGFVIIFRDNWLFCIVILYTYPKSSFIIGYEDVLV